MASRTLPAHTLQSSRSASACDEAFRCSAPPHVTAQHHRRRRFCRSRVGGLTAQRTKRQQLSQQQQQQHARSCRERSATLLACCSCSPDVLRAAGDATDTRSGVVCSGNMGHRRDRLTFRWQLLPCPGSAAAALACRGMDGWRRSSRRVMRPAAWAPARRRQGRAADGHHVIQSGSGMGCAPASYLNVKTRPACRSEPVREKMVLIGWTRHSLKVLGTALKPRLVMSSAALAVLSGASCEEPSAELLHTSLTTTRVRVKYSPALPLTQHLCRSCASRIAILADSPAASIAPEVCHASTSLAGIPLFPRPHPPACATSPAARFIRRHAFNCRPSLRLAFACVLVLAGESRPRCCSLHLSCPHVSCRTLHNTHATRHIEGSSQRLQTPVRGVCFHHSLPCRADFDGMTPGFERSSRL